MKMVKIGFAAAVCALTGAAFGAATLERAGELLVEVDASAVTAEDGAAVVTIANTGTAGGTFVPRDGKAGAKYSANVGGIPAFTFVNTDTIMTNTVLPSANLLGANPWSVEAWVYNPSFANANETYFAWTPREGLEANARTVMECRYSNAAGNSTEHYTTNLGWGGMPAVAGAWHYLVATRAADGTECYYVDGLMRDKQTIALNLRTDGAFTLGGVWYANGNGWGNAFSGSLAALRVHSGTLTAAQVYANYNAEAGTRVNRWKGVAGTTLAWDDPANWVQGTVPANLLIDNGGIAEFSSGEVALNTMHVPNGGVVIDGADVTVRGAMPQHVHFGQGPGSEASLVLRTGSLVHVGTNDTHIFLSRRDGISTTTIGGGASPAYMVPDRDLYIAYHGCTAEMTLLENGSAATPEGWTYIAYGAGAHGRVTIDGGALGARSAAEKSNRVVIGNDGGDGELVLDSGFLFAKESLSFSYATADTTSRSIFRMNGGDAYVGQFAVGNASTEGRVFFNGGVVHAVANQNNYMKNLDSATVSAGGVTFDVPAGVTIRIDQALLEDAESAGGVIRKTGAGRLVLAGANTVSTPVDLQEGELLFANADALASFPSVTAAPGTAVGGMWAGAPAAALAKLDPSAQAAIILTSANASDPVDFTGRVGMTLKTDGTFNYTGAFTPAATDSITIDVGAGTLTYPQTIANVGGVPTSVTVKGNGGKLVVTSAQNFTGGLTVDGATVQFNSASTVPATGAITLANHARLDFMVYQDVAAIVARLTAGSDGLLILHDPTAITSDLDFSQLPGIVLGTATNTVYSGTITPGNGAYRFGGGNATYSGPASGMKFSNLADVGGATRVVIGEPGITWLAAGNTYSGGTVVTNKGILYLAGADGLGALPAEKDPDNIFIDGGIVRGGANHVTIPETRGVTIGERGATFHQWSTYAFNVLGDLHGAGQITMSDSGWVTFAGAANDFTGNLVVNGGANTRIGDGETFSWDENTGATINGRLAIKTNHELTLGQTFTGAGVLRKEGSGTLTLTSPQAYGTTQIGEGTLRVKDATVLPSGGGRGVMEVQSSGTFDTEGKALAVASLKGGGLVANSSGAAGVLTISSAAADGDFSGTIADTITIEKTGANTQTFTAESASSARVPAIVAREGVVELNKQQRVGNLTIAGGTLRVRNGAAGLTGRYYTRTAAQMSSAATTLSSIAGIDAFEAATDANLTESSTALGSTFDANSNGDRFPVAYRNSDNYIVVWRGVISLPSDGSWGFALNSDDGSVLYIDGEKVVDNLKDQGYADSQRTGTRKFVNLSKGEHEIIIGYYEKTGSNALTAYVMRPGAAADEKMPMSMLSSPVLGGVNEVARIDADDGVIAFADEGAPRLALTQDGDVEIGVPLNGDNPRAELIKRGNGTLTLTSSQNDFAGVLSVESGSLHVNGVGPIGIINLSSGTTLTVPGGEAAEHNYLRARYYTGYTTFDYANMKNYEQMETFFNGLTPNHDLTTFSVGGTLDFGTSGAKFEVSGDNFMLYLSGAIYIPESGSWQFAVDSDDGSAVWIDGKSVAARTSDIGMSGDWGTQGAAVQLTRGLHEIRIAYREASGLQGLRVAMKGPEDADYAYIPQSLLFRDGKSICGLAGAAGSRVDAADAMLMIVQDGDTGFAGAVEGVAGARIIKYGVGTLSLTGAIDGYAGTWQVDDGAVRFASGGVAHVANLTGVGKVIVDGGTDLVVAASDFKGDVEVIDGSFTVTATGTQYLSGFAGTIAGDTLGVAGGGRVYFNPAEGSLGVKTVAVRGDATACVSGEEQLGWADVALDGGTLQVQRELMPGTTVLADISDIPGEWQLNGDARAKQLNGKEYLFLVECADTHTGTAFRKAKVNVAQPWYAKFTFHTVTNGVKAPADGFSFMIQNSAATAKGGSGGCTGGAVYENADKVLIKPAVAVVQGIYNSARCGIFKDGSGLPNAGYAAMTGFDRTKDVDYVITYDGARLSVEARQGGKVFTREANVDLAAHFGGNEAFVGFTASTGGSHAEMGILGFEMRNVAGASPDFSQTDVTVVSDGALRSQFDEAVGFGALIVEGDATLTLGDANGTGTGEFEFEMLDCSAGGTLKVVGGSLAARDGVLTIVVPTPIEPGAVIKLLDLSESQWTGPLSVNLVDAAGNPVKARAFISGGFLKVSTAEHTIIYIR